MTSTSEKQRKSARFTGLVSAAVALGMVGAAFAAVPLYKRFCQATGYDGTVRQAQAKPTKVLDRTLVIRFDTNVRGLDWDFKADQLSQTVKIGQTGLAFFHVTNRSDKPVTGHAAYNVAPEAAGRHFQKLECFCFTDQTLQPGQSMDFPVVYFVDPSYVTDADAKDGQEITLSYTFFPISGPPPQPKSAQASPTKATSALGADARAAL
ncbi:MAG: cytochrome c oxidase assembly protein [Caulobacteraceae bacterium]|nr:cytochrome c oxidase assembly protein [Caulobacteraceae bacterium]